MRLPWEKDIDRLMPGPFRSILQISCCSSLDCSQNICHYYMSEEIFHCLAVIFVTFLNHETSHDWTIFIVLVRFNKAFSHKLSWITLNKLDGLFFTGRRLEHCLVIFYLKKEDLNLILDRWRSSKMSELQLDPESHKTSSSNSVDIFRHISQGTLPSNLTNKFVHNCFSWDHPMENERQSNQNLFSVTQVNEIIPAGLNL